MRSNSDSFYSRLATEVLGFRYGAVVRKPGSYVPPGARKGPATSAATSIPSQQTHSANPNAPADGLDAVNVPAKADPPKVSVNGPDGVPKAPSPVPAANKVCINK